MKIYRLSDQHYYDSYDRSTIEILKELEAKEAAELSASPPETRLYIIAKHAVGPLAFKNRGISMARNRETTVQKWIAKDERLDKLVARYPQPSGICCNTCKENMEFSTHFFDVDNIPLLFLFVCPQGHRPGKTVFPDGREYFFPKPTCSKCGSEVSEATKREGDVLHTTSTCPHCRDVVTDELHLKTKAESVKPISEEDKKKYLLEFINQKTFYEDLEALASLYEMIDEGEKQKALMDVYEVHKIEKLTIPILESRLQKGTSDAGFTKLAFDRPEMKQYTVIPFNLQDPTDRDEGASIKAGTACIKDMLQFSNWRLQGKLEYRLGYLTGKLKAYERDEDLIKLAKEMKDG